MSESNNIIPFPTKQPANEENPDKNQPKRHIRTPGRTPQATELSAAAKNENLRSEDPIINLSQETFLGHPFSDDEFEKMINPNQNNLPTEQEHTLLEDSAPYELEEIKPSEAIASIIQEEADLLRAIYDNIPKIQDMLDIANQSQTQLTHSLILIAALYELTPYEDKEKIQFANLIHQLNLKFTNQNYNWKKIYTLSSKAKQKKQDFITACINNFYKAKEEEVHSDFYHLTPSTQI